MSAKEEDIDGINLKPSSGMNLRSKGHSSKHDIASAGTSVGGVLASRQTPELDERHPGQCDSDVEVGTPVRNNTKTCYVHCYYSFI